MFDNTQRVAGWHYQVVKDPVKGRCVISETSLSPGDFACEYRGELVDRETAELRQQWYDVSSKTDDSKGFMFYFRDRRGNQMWYVLHNVTQPALSLFVAL